MSRFSIKDLPVVNNICEQVLREVEHQPTWSMAHVTMNPLASSLLHNHMQTREIYAVIKGYGEIHLGNSLGNCVCYPVVAGSVYQIPIGVPHMLCNKSGGYLEHLVFALPPFDPADVYLLGQPTLTTQLNSLSLPEPQDCFDGAKILPYAFNHLDLSIAFGWVSNNPTRHKKPHYHTKITEFVYVVEGKGLIEINGTREIIYAGDWIRINTQTEHGLLNQSPEDLVVVCTCCPMFEMSDVHYRDH